MKRVRLRRTARLLDILDALSMREATKVAIESGLELTPKEAWDFCEGVACWTADEAEASLEAQARRVAKVYGLDWKAIRRSWGTRRGGS